METAVIVVSFASFGVALFAAYHAAQSSSAAQDSADASRRSADAAERSAESSERYTAIEEERRADERRQLDDAARRAEMADVRVGSVPAGSSSALIAVHNRGPASAFHVRLEIGSLAGSLHDESMTDIDELLPDQTRRSRIALSIADPARANVVYSWQDGRGEQVRQVVLEFV